MNNKDYTKELSKVIKYMTEILVNEFPTDEFTPEYLILSILDNIDSHAYMILDNSLMTENIEQLREIYVNFLRNREEKQIFNINKRNNEDLECIINNAEKEKEKMGTHLIGSEHILLSMLSEETNNVKMQEVFKNIGIDYNFVKRKTFEKDKSKNIAQTSNKLMKPNFSMPLKSEINTKVVSNGVTHIDNYTINITEEAKEGKIDKLIGREKELSNIIRAMARRKKNNVVLVGNSGCGKTQIINGLAKMILEQNVPDFLIGKEIVKLNIMALISGTHFRGMLEERVNNLFKELKNNKKYILFIDDMQTILKTGSKDKDTDLTSVLNDILATDEVQVIGTINQKDYRNGIETKPTLVSQLQKITIEPLSINDTIRVLNTNKEYYEQFHNVIYTDEVIETSVKLADRYVTNKCLPDSAFDVIDLLGADQCFKNSNNEEIKFAKTRLLEIDGERSNSLNEGDFEYADKLTQEENALKILVANYNKNKKEIKQKININDVYNIISQMSNVPITKLSINGKSNLSGVENTLKKYIVGQDEAICDVSKIIKRNRVGLGDKTKCMGALLLVGQTGTGKTLLAKKLAEEVFGDKKALIRFDMSEYSEKNSVSKLIGSSPGYVGYENGGQLTEAVKNKPYCVLLLDELEKSDSEVQNMFLQVLDDGRITDNSGQIIDFKNVIILMTSNVGAQKASEFGNGIGFSNDESTNKKEIINKEIKKKFTPEFLNRIDKIVYFNPLTDENLGNIVELELNILKDRVEELKYYLEWDNDVIEYLKGKAIQEKKFGARPIKRIIQNDIEDYLTTLLIDNEYQENHNFKIKTKDNEILIDA